VCGVLLALVLGTPLYAQPPGPRPAIVLSVNSSVTRQIVTKKKIKEIAIDNPRIARVSVLPSLDSVVIVGQDFGSATVTLTDEDDKKDEFEVVVSRFDIDALKRLIRNVAPTSNVSIEGAGNGLVLTGTVDRAEEVAMIETAVRTAASQGTGGGAQGSRGLVQIINAVRVGGVQQVQLDVVVAQVSRNELRNLNVNFLFNGQSFYGANTLGGAVLQPGSVGSPGAALSSAASPILATPGAQTNILAGIVSNSGNFLFFLQALRTEGVLKLVAEPRLVTMSGRPAEFLSGGEQAVPVASGLGTAGVEFVPFGTSVIFLPVVLGNGKIHLEVQPEVSTLDPASGTTANGAVVPGRNTQRVRTTVEMEVGQTFVIGGLIQHASTGTIVRTPFLGDLPFIGTWFSNKTFNDQEVEILIMVTPHLVDAMDCAQAPKCIPGSESRIPDDFELFLEGILEAPRGSRCICPGGHYVPAFKHDPTIGQFPCGTDACGAGCGNGGNHGCATPGCVSGKMIEETSPIQPASAKQVVPNTTQAAPKTSSQPKLLPSVKPDSKPAKR